MKRCTGCRRTLAESEFHNTYRRGKSEKVARCKSCISEAAKRWYHNNREKCLSVCLEYRTTHRKQVRQYADDWRKRNAERVKIQQRIRRQRRRALMQDNGGSFTRDEWSDLLRWFDSRCAYCNQQSGALEVDHVVALTRGGRNDISNIVPACRSCNSSKGNNGPLDLLTKPHLLVTQRMFSE